MAKLMGQFLNVRCQKVRNTKKNRIVFHYFVPPSCHYYAASTTDVLTLNIDALLDTTLNF